MFRTQKKLFLMDGVIRCLDKMCVFVGADVVAVSISCNYISCCADDVMLCFGIKSLLVI